MATATTSELLSEPVVRRLIQAAGWAPSADNNQPWAFRRSGDSILVLHRRDRALPSDTRDMFSLISIGAAVENMIVEASAHALGADIELKQPPFPASIDGEHVASVHFHQAIPRDSLHEFLQLRVTNRKLYSPQPLEDDELAVLSSECVCADHSVIWLHERQSLKTLSSLVFTADRIRFEHEPFHREFHKVLRFSDQESRQTGDGLELKTLEIPAIATPLFRALAPWSRMQLANRFGMSRMFAGNSRKQVVKSGAVGLLVTNDESDHRYLTGGRSFERIWLAAASRGLAFQPLGGLPMFLTKLKFGDLNGLGAAHCACLGELAAPFYELFPKARGQSLVMLFRVGRAQPPSARSYRYPVEKITAGVE